MKPISILLILAFLTFADPAFLKAGPEGTQSVYLSLRDRLAPSLVRLETTGGDERVGDVNAIRETTGLIVTSDGFLFSSAAGFAHHPDAVIAVTSDGSRLPARIVCTDFVRKITLLKINPPQSASSFPIPEAAAPSTFRVGQKVLTLGRVLNPSVPSLTTGILSGKNRQHGLAIQTDAHVSPDNFGGPLLDLDGRVLGVLTPFGMGENDLLTGVDLYDSGIGFAIPLHDLLALLPRMKSASELRPAPKLGLLFRNPSPILTDTLVLMTEPDSLAHAAGIQPGDRITHADGQPLTRASDFQAALARHFQGETLELTILRKNETISVRILLKDLEKKEEN